MREMLFDGPQRRRDNGCIAQIFKMDGEDFRGGLLAWSSAFGKVRSPGFSRPSAVPNSEATAVKALG